MKKSTKLIKRFSVLFLIVLMSIESFAAVVSDNDGAAFITKAEFDSMRIDFQKQMNDFNSTLGDKIDLAVSSYLDGIKISGDVVNLYDHYIKTNNRKPIFYNKLPGTGSNTNTPNVVINVTREQAYQLYSNLNYNQSHWFGYQKQQYDSTAGLYFGDIDWSGSYSSWTMLWQRKQFVHNVSESDKTYSERTGGTMSTYKSSPTGISSTYTKKSVTSFGSNTASTGAGSGWISQVLNGENTLKFYDSKLYIDIKFDVWAHRYKNFASLTASYYTTNAGKSDNQSLEQAITKPAALGTYAVGTKYTGTSDQNGIRVDYGYNKFEQRTDITNFIPVIFATSTTNSIYYIDETEAPTFDASTSDYTTSNLTYSDVYYDGAGGHLQTNNLGTVKLTYYKAKYQMNQKAINKFHIPSVSALLNNTKVYHGEGFPIFRVDKAGVDKTRLSIVFKSSSGNINYKISKGKLSNNAFTNVNNKIAEGTATSGSTVTINQINNLKANDVIYVNCYSATNGQTATIDSVTVRKIS